MTERWDVIWSQAALKALKKLDKSNRERIFRAAQLLSDNPHPPAAKRVTGASGVADTSSLFRIRTGDWRLLYVVQDRELIVLIVKVGHRSEIYKRF